MPLVLAEQGIGHYQMGQAVTLYLDPRRYFVFDAASGALVGRTAEE